jgi:hypothetical protein
MVRQTEVIIKETELDLDPFFVQSQEHIPNAKNRRLDSGFEYTGRHA